MAANGTAFAAPQPGQNSPAFSYYHPLSPTDDQHSIDDAPKLIATTSSTTTPGFWKITVQADVTFTSATCGNGSASTTREIVITVGNVPDFDLTIAPDPVSIAQGLGGTTQVTVTSKNGFSGDVALSLSNTNIPAGLMSEFYDPAVNPQNPPPFSVHLSSGGSDAATLSLCVAAGTAPGNYTLTIQGTSGGLTHTRDFTLTVTTAPTIGKAYTGTSTTPPTGIFRKVESAPGFNGLSASVVLASPDADNSSLVSCTASGDTQDEAYTYTGGVSGGSYLDIGFQLGHTGNKIWKFDIKDSSAVPINPSTGKQFEAPKKPPLVTVSPGAVTIIFEAPGYKRQFGELALPSLNTTKTDAMVDANNVLLDGYFALVVPGKDPLYFKDRNWRSNAASIKRVNSIAQKIIPGNFPNGLNGPGKGFEVTGSKVLNGSWAGVRLYDQSHPNTGKTTDGKAFTGTDSTYPGKPYVGWGSSGTFTKYDNESAIDLATVPLPESYTPNPQ